MPWAPVRAALQRPAPEAASGAWCWAGRLLERVHRSGGARLELQCVVWPRPNRGRWLAVGLRSSRGPGSVEHLALTLVGLVAAYAPKRLASFAGAGRLVPLLLLAASLPAAALDRAEAQQGCDRAPGAHHLHRAGGLARQGGRVSTRVESITKWALNHGYRATIPGDLERASGAEILGA